MFLKQDGVARIGRWFCSDACAETDEEVKRMTMAQNRLAKEMEEDNEGETVRGMGRRRKNRQKARGGTILQRNEKDQEDGKKEEAEEQDCTAKRKLKRRTVQQQRREAGKVR